MKRYAVCLVASILIAFTCVAQEPSRGPDGGTSTHVSGVEILNIPGKPFSAKTTTEWVRTTEDGDSITLRLEATLARDGQGRVYRERRSFVPAGSNERPRLNEVHLYDPTTRSQALCSARTFVCVITDFYPQTTFIPANAGAYDSGNRFLNRESLGRDVIEGINVVGTRETRTINPGVAGNDRPLVYTREFWYAPEIETNLKVTRIDPATGKQVIWLSEISIAEPDPHMFELPIGYTARDERASAHHIR